MSHTFRRPLRVLSIVEATTVTGPVKPLLMFSEHVRQPSSQHPGLTHRILTTRRKLAAPDLLANAVENAGAEFVAVAERHAGDPRVLPAMRRATIEFQPDIVETHDSKSHFIFLLLRSLNQALREIPWIAFHHGYTRVSHRVRIYQQLDLLSLPRATRVNTVCEPFKETLVQRGVLRGRVNVLTNAVAIKPLPADSVVAAARSTMGKTLANRVLLSVGRLSAEKGHADLLAALSRLPDEVLATTRLVLVGDGPERSKLEGLAAPLKSQVLFLGHVPDPWPLYCVADIFVLPSLSEGSPLVMFEAMTAGLPIVACAVGGIPEVLSDRVTALLVPPGQSLALTTALEQVLTSDELRGTLGAGARHAIGNYSPQAYANRLLEIYFDCCRAP